MDWQDWALIGAGLVNIGIAIPHAILLQRLIDRLRATGALSERSAAMVPPLLHLSSVAWVLGGVGLIAAALWLGAGARMTLVVVMLAVDAYGGIVAGRAGGLRHPGALAMTLAVILLLASLLR